MRPVRISHVPAVAVAAAAAWVVSVGVLAQGDVARLVSVTPAPAECLSALQSVVIDGRPVPTESALASQEQSLAGEDAEPWEAELLPGVHRVTGVVRLDTSECKSARGDAGVTIAPVEAVFEAGRTYHIGFDHSAIDAADWRLVIRDADAPAAVQPAADQ